jgi:hypothetical protein
MAINGFAVFGNIAASRPGMPTPIARFSGRARRSRSVKTLTWEEYFDACQYPTTVFTSSLTKWA